MKQKSKSQKLTDGELPIMKGIVGKRTTVCKTDSGKLPGATTSSEHSRHNG